MKIKWKSNQGTSENQMNSNENQMNSNENQMNSNENQIKEQMNLFLDFSFLDQNPLPKKSFYF